MTRSAARSVLLTLLQPAGSAVSAVIAFGVLLVATRDGQFQSIASFAAGGATAALASVLVGGGTTLAYTTGDTERQHAVRQVRVRVVLPAVLLVTAATTLTYAEVSELAGAGVAAGGLAVLAGVGAELDASFLRRHLGTGRLLIADVSNRLGALTVILMGAHFAEAMLAGALVRSVLLRIFSRADPTRRRGRALGRHAFRSAYAFNLTSLSVLYAVSDRLGAIIAPLVAPVQIAGGYAATVNAQQSAGGVLMTGLQTTLAARSQQRRKLAWANHLDTLFIVAACGVAAVMIYWREAVWQVLGLPTTAQPSAYWVPIMLLIPASIMSRVLEFQLLARQASSAAALARASATTVVIASAIVSFAKSDLSAIAWGLVFAEGASVLLAAYFLKRRPPIMEGLQ